MCAKKRESGSWFAASRRRALAPAPGRVVLQVQAAYAGSAIADFVVEIDPPNGARRRERLRRR